MSRNL